MHIKLLLSTLLSTCRFSQSPSSVDWTFLPLCRCTDSVGCVPRFLLVGAPGSVLKKCCKVLVIGISGSVDSVFVRFFGLVLLSAACIRSRFSPLGCTVTVDCLLSVVLFLLAVVCVLISVGRLVTVLFAVLFFVRFVLLLSCHPGSKCIAVVALLNSRSEDAWSSVD